jgi:glucose-fructose oxidoreductase
MAGGGAMFDTGVYGVQAACMMTGKSPVAVRGMPTTRHRELFPQGVEETMSFELIFDDGFQALCRASYSNNFHQCTTLGHKGMVEVLPGVPTGSVYGQSAGGKPNDKRLVINKREIEAKNTLQLGVMLDAFARSITDKTSFLCPGEMGLRDVRIIEAIYASAKRGGARVELRP